MKPHNVMYFLVKQSVQQEIILFICQDLIGSWKIGIYTVMLLASTSLSVTSSERKDSELENIIILQKFYIENIFKVS